MLNISMQETYLVMLNRFTCISGEKLTTNWVLCIARWQVLFPFCCLWFHVGISLTCKDQWNAFRVYSAA